MLKVKVIKRGKKTQSRVNQLLKLAQSVLPNPEGSVTGITLPYHVLATRMDEAGKPSENYHSP